MLLSFRVGNHRSLREEQQLNLIPVYEADRPEGGEWEAVPVAAIFGANAAGKSNVVDALRFMARMVRHSHQDAEPGSGIVRKPFALDPKGPGSPSWYVVDLLLDRVRYTYGFSIDDNAVLEEWLYAYPHARKRKMFERSAEGITFGDSVPKKELELVESITEANALFLTVAARSRQESVQAVYQWFSRAMSFRSGGPDLEAGDAPTRLLSDAERAPSVVALLQAADLGIEGAGVEDEQEARERQRRELIAVAAELREITLPPGIVDMAAEVAQRAREIADTSTLRLTPWQSTYDVPRRIWIEQRGRKGTTRLSLADQSQGTIALLRYSAPVLEALERGGVLVIDEVDSSLHPKLTAHLISLFQEPKTNPGGAQLLLTTHDASLLGHIGGKEILKRDQIWFVEKNEYGETTLFPLSDFKPRQHENRERRYLGGSYGAVPFLSDERFEEAVAARGRTDDAASGTTA
jgi:predicted ATPase